MAGGDAWQVQPLTRVEQDDAELVVRLTAAGGAVIRQGKYRVRAFATLTLCEAARVRVLDVRHNRNLAGQGGYSGSGGRTDTAVLIMEDVFTLRTDSELRLQQASSNANGSPVGEGPVRPAPTRSARCTASWSCGGCSTDEPRLLANPVGSDATLRLRKREYMLVRYEVAASAGDPVGGYQNDDPQHASSTTRPARCGSRRTGCGCRRGLYKAIIKTWGMNEGHHSCRLRDVTRGANLLVGNGTYGSPGGNGSYQTNQSIGHGVFTLTTDALVELQAFYGSSAGSGWSMGIGTLGNGFLERFQTVELWRLAA